MQPASGILVGLTGLHCAEGNCPQRLSSTSPQTTTSSFGEEAKIKTKLIESIVHFCQIHPPTLQNKHTLTQRIDGNHSNLTTCTQAIDAPSEDDIYDLNSKVQHIDKYGYVRFSLLSSTTVLKIFVFALLKKGFLHKVKLTVS